MPWAVIFSPMGKIIMIGLALLTWTVYQREQAASKATAQCQSEQLRQTIKEMTRQRDQAIAALADAEKRQAADDAALAKLEREGDAIKKDTAPLKKDPCNVPPSATKRMRNVR